MTSLDIALPFGKTHTLTEVCLSQQLVIHDNSRNMDLVCPPGTRIRGGFSFYSWALGFFTGAGLLFAVQALKK